MKSVMLFAPLFAINQSHSQNLNWGSDSSKNSISDTLQQQKQSINMVSLNQLEIKVGFFDQFKKLALKYCNVENDNWLKRPKKDDLVKMFERLDFKVKYVSLDRLFIEKYTVGDYSFEYYYEFNGTCPSILIYVKKTKEYWPIERYGLGIDRNYDKSKIKSVKDLKGLDPFPENLEELEHFFKEMKPYLDALRKEAICHLERGELDFSKD